MRAFATSILFLALGTVAAPAAGGAHEINAGSLVIEHPWARATATPQQTGAAYMIIRNRGAEPDRLLAARSGEAASVTLHGSSVDAQGVARMREAGPIEIPAGGEARLAPGGVHVMLDGLKTPLFEGVSYPLTLVFERAGEIGVEVEVQGAAAPPDHGGGHHQGH